jgi:sugar phosphate isomerase/epimerase
MSGILAAIAFRSRVTEDAFLHRRAKCFEGNFMNRRGFVRRSAGALAGWTMGSMLTQGAVIGEETSKRSRIGVSTWSFHNFFPSTRDDKARTGAALDMLDFPEMIADRYQVHELEFVAPHFASTTAAYIKEVKDRLQKVHSHLVNIPVDIDELELGAGLSDADAKLRERIIEACSKWIDIAHELGASSVRCDPGKINSADLSPTVDSYRKLSAYGASKNVAVVVENHGGVGSEHPGELVKIFDEVGDKWFGALPDFGNFQDRKTRERGLRLLFPYAQFVCHAKARANKEYGDDMGVYVKTCVDIARAANYQGVYSIEYSGSDPYAGVPVIINLLLKYI